MPSWKTVRSAQNGTERTPRRDSSQAPETFAAAATEGPDTLDGTPDADTLDGLGGNDIINGLGGDDILIGGTGADTLNGGADNDTYVVDNPGDTVTEVTGEGNDRVTVAGLGYVLNAGAAVETLSTTDSAGTAPTALTGNEIGQLIIGNAGSNFLLGGGGADTLDGQAGDDVIFVDADDTVIEAVGGGNDLVAAMASYKLNAGAAVETLSTTYGGGLAAIALTGNEFGQTIIGNAGNNFVYGAGGADILNGGAGGDLYIVDGDDQVIEAVGGGNDLVAALSSFALNAGAEVETLTTINAGSAAAIALTGNEFGQTIIGNLGDNFLYGGGGADTLDGGAGSDVIIVDTDDKVIDAATGDNDLVAALTSYKLTAGARVETLSTTYSDGTAAIALTGNEIGGQTIIGNAGNNFLDGGGGGDMLIGGAGDDTIIINSSDFVVEEVGGGNDIILARVSYGLNPGAEVETLSTTFPGDGLAINLIGNEFGQTLIGNFGRNVLDGREGNDTLIGWGENSQTDSFRFTTAPGPNNVDLILDFRQATDRIQLDDAIFTALNPGSQTDPLHPITLNANMFVIGAAAQDFDDRIVYDKTTGYLFYDADGVGGSAGVLFAMLQNGPVLSASDIQII